MKETVCSCLVALILFEGVKALLHAWAYQLGLFEPKEKPATLCLIGLAHLLAGLAMLWFFLQPQPFNH